MTYEERMQELLAYANFRKVGDALDVSRQQVAQWAKGRDVNVRRLHQVEDLLRPQRAGEADPTNGELLTEMRAIRRLLQRQAKPAAVNVEELAAALVDGLARREDARRAAGSRKPERAASRGRKVEPQPAGKR